LLLLLRACLFGSQESRGEKKMTSFLKVFLLRYTTAACGDDDDGREKKTGEKQAKNRRKRN
jgi:hypothetical protein